MKTTYRGVRLNPDAGATSRTQIDVLTEIGGQGGQVIAHPLVHRPLHSPTGMNWGYAGSGPADLALAILLDYLQEVPTEDQLRMGMPLGWRLHQFFKRDFVAGWKDSWSITSDEIQAWMESDQIDRHVKTHAELWREMEEIIGHDFGPGPEMDLRSVSSDPAYRRYDDPTVPLKGVDDAGE